MARKLTFLLTDRTGWKLVGRTALALGGFFLWRNFGGFLSFLGAAAALAFAYFWETEERKMLRRTFLALAVIGFIGFGARDFLSVAFFPVFAVFWTAACFAAFGIVRFIFHDRRLVYGFLNTLVFFLVFLLFFHFGRPGGFWFIGTTLFFTIVFLLGETFRFLEACESRRSFLQTLAAGFILIEFAWISLLLPLGFWNAALFLTLVFVVLRETIIARFKGELNLAFFLKELAIMLTLGLIIFAASTWTV